MDDKGLAQELADRAGISRTVYSLIYPETRAITRALWAGAEAEGLHEMYEAAWTKRQDPMHLALIEGWLAWTAPVLDLDAAAFPHRYPTNGSNEAIREGIAGHRARHPAAKLHVFSGDYEGYEAMAAAYGMPIVRHDRSRAESVPGDASFGPQDIFVLSHPSSIDGNLWPGYDAFLQAMVAQGREVHLDLCYVGCVGRPYRIDARYPSITKVYWSLSKVFGVYYHRVGGVLSRQEMPGLYGNMWFKNLLSIELGRRLLAATSVHLLPQRYKPWQDRAVAHIAQILGNAPPVQASDVVILATQEVDRAALRPIDRAMGRGLDSGAAVARFCLTPHMGTALDAAVSGAAR